METNEHVEVEITPRTLSLYKKALNTHMETLRQTCSNLEIALLQVGSDFFGAAGFEKLQQTGMIR